MWDEWETDLRIYHECPFKSSSKIIAVPISLLITLRRIERMTNNEFLMYCDCEEKEGVIIVNNCHFPRQEVTTASVDVEEPSLKPVVIHRHPRGVHGFSGTDYEYINANHRISLLFVDGKIRKGVITEKMPCGIYMYVPINDDDIIYIFDKIDVDEDLIKQFNENVKVKVYHNIDYKEYYRHL